MPTRKIADLNPRLICTDPEHNPPSHMVFEEGVYEHECPSCHKITRFTVSKPRLYSGTKAKCGACTAGRVTFGGKWQEICYQCHGKCYVLV